MIQIPKIEFICKDNDKSSIEFSIRNVSSVILSSIRLISFDLIYLYGETQDMLIEDLLIPTSLSPSEEKGFKCNHSSLKHIGIGYKEFKLIFEAEDECRNLFSIIVTKNVEDKRKPIFGSWDTKVQIKKPDDGETEIMDKPTVFISYNWDSSDTADKVEKQLSPIATILRDKSSIMPWGSIGEFMKRIRQTDLVVVIVSDSYLKSENCMYEIMELLKNDNWITNSMFLIEDSAKDIYKTIGQLKYVQYWADEQKKLEKALSGKNPAHITTQAEKLNRIQSIQLNINSFMATVADRNNPDLTKAIGEVVKRVRENHISCTNQ